MNSSRLSFHPFRFAWRVNQGGLLNLRRAFPSRQWFWWLLWGTIVLLWLTVCFPVWAVPVGSVPNPRQDYGWVSDMANILPASAETSLNRQLADLEANNGTEVAVVTVLDTRPFETPKQFATTLFNTWGIGKQRRNNGVLVLISKGDRRVEIEIGDGLKLVLSRANIRAIIQTEMVPYFRQGDFAGGTLAGVQALIHQLESPAQTVIRHPDRPSDFFQGLWVTVGVVILMLLSWQWDNLTKCLFPVLLVPTGTSLVDLGVNAPIAPLIKCATCQEPMQPVAEIDVLAQLNPIQQISQRIGHIRAEGWRCSRCQPDSTSPFHLRIYLRTRDPLHRCPQCQELTAEQATIVLEPATPEQPGKQRVIHWCHYCQYRLESEESLPWRSATVSDVEDAAMRNIYSSDSGGGSFGGGHSSGGGDGGSW